MDSTSLIKNENNKREKAIDVNELLEEINNNSGGIQAMLLIRITIILIRIRVWNILILKINNIQLGNGQIKTNIFFYF